MYYLGNRYSDKIWKNSFVVCKIKNCLTMSLNIWYSLLEPQLQQLSFRASICKWNWDTCWSRPWELFFQSHSHFHKVHLDFIWSKLLDYLDWKSWKTDSEYHIIFDISKSLECHFFAKFTLKEWSSFGRYNYESFIEIFFVAKLFS